MNYPEVNPAAKYLAEARMEALSEGDPYDRAFLLSACIEEGDAAVMREPAIAAYRELPTGDVRSEQTWETPSQTKERTGRAVALALAKAGDFETAYSLLMDIETYRSDSHSRAKFDLLGMGYPGPDGELLHSFDETFLLPALHGESKDPNMDVYDVENYLHGLAKYGVDITVPGTPAYTLFNQVEAVRSDFLHNRFAATYYEIGKRTTAAFFASRVRQHSSRGKMLLHFTEFIEDSDPVLADIAREVDGLTLDALDCHNTCSDKYCNPERDGGALALPLAGLYARLGNTSRARMLLREFEVTELFPNERLESYLKLYEVEGKEAERTKTLDRLTQSLYMPRRTGQAVRRMAQADIRYGRTLPSLEADGESVPLVALELSKTMLAKARPIETREGEIGIEDFFDPEGDDHTKYKDKERRNKRADGFAALSLLLAENGAPITAHHMEEQIDVPDKRIRTRLALAKLHGADLSAS